MHKNLDVVYQLTAMISAMVTMGITPIIPARAPPLAHPAAFQTPAVLPPIFYGCVDGICDESHDFTVFKIFGGVAALGNTTLITDPQQHDTSSPYPKVKPGEIYQAPVVGIKKIVIGENMARVEKYASQINGDIYRPRQDDPIYEVSIRRNKQWTQDKMKNGHRLIDIGPDFSRRRKNHDIQGGDISDFASPFYNLEREQIEKYKYDKYKKAFSRSGPKVGEVDKIDFSKD